MPPSVAESSLPMIRRAGAHDNTAVTSMTLHSSRPTPSTTEEFATTPAASVCQQTTTVEIHTDAPLQCSDLVVRTAVRSRPVTSRQLRASVRGRTVSMPSWRPVNLDVANDNVLYVIPSSPTSAAAKEDLGCQQEEVGRSEDIEISISSPRTLADNGCSAAASSSAAFSISLSGRTTIAGGSRPMSHVTPDFDPPPPPRRFDVPLPASSHQVRVTSRPTNADDRRPVRPSRTRDAGADDLESARRRYFSIAEWNRQKVLHLRRASLRRACLIGIPLSWTHLGGPADRGYNATAKCRRRQTNRHRTTNSPACSERSEPRSISSEVQSKASNNQSLPPISETTSMVADNGRAARRRRTTKSSHQQNQALSNDSTQKRAAVSIPRCPPLTQPTCPSYTVSRTTPRSTHKLPEATDQTVSAPAQQQKPEAYDSGLDSDAAATRNTTEHQSLPPVTTVVDLQKVKDVLEHRPPSRGRTHKDEDDKEDDRTDAKTINDDNGVSCNNASNRNTERSAEHVDNISRPTVLTPRSEPCHDDDEYLREARDVISTKILSRKQSVPSGDCRGGTYIYRFPGRRTTDAGLLTYDSKSSTPGLLEPVDLVTDCSRPVSSMSSSIAVDEITSLPGSPFYRQVLQRRSSSIDSSIMSRPGSDLLDVPIFLVQPRDRSPSMVSDTETPSVAESPITSPVCIVTTEERDLQQQVVHRLSETVQLPPVTPCQSPEHTADQGTDHETTQRCGVAIDVPQLVQAPQVSLTTDDGDDFDVWFGRRGSIFIEERGATQRQNFLAQQITKNAKGQVSLAVPKHTADN